MEWVTTSLCENLSLSSPKYSVPALSELVVRCEVIVVVVVFVFVVVVVVIVFVFCFFLSSTQTVFTGVLRVVTEYESSRMIISAQMRTGQRVVVVLHYVTVVFLTPYFCVRNVGDTLSARWRIPLLWESSLRFL